MNVRSANVLKKNLCELREDCRYWITAVQIDCQTLTSLNFGCAKSGGSHSVILAGDVARVSGYLIPVKGQPNSGNQSLQHQGQR